MCFSLLTVILLVVGAPGCQTSRASVSNARNKHGQFRADKDENK